MFFCRTFDIVEFKHCVLQVKHFVNILQIQQKANIQSKHLGEADTKRVDFSRSERAQVISVSRLQNRKEMKSTSEIKKRKNHNIVPPGLFHTQATHVASHS